MKKVFVCILLTALLFGTVLLLIPKFDEEPVGSVELSVNPNVELLINKDNKVVNVIYKNGYAEIVFSGEDLIGMDIKEVSEKFVQTAIDAGYIDVATTGETVEFNVVVANDELKKSISESLTKEINDCFDANGVFGQAKAKVLEIADKAELLGVTAYKYQLIMTAKSLDPVKEIEELKALSEKELRDLINAKVTEYKGIAADKMTNLITRIETLMGEFNAMFEKADVIEDLENQIDNSSLLPESTKEALKKNLEDARKVYNDLKAEFEQKIQEIINQVKEESKTIIENAKNELAAHKTAVQEKIATHKAEFEANKEARLAEIKAWRESQNAA